MIKPRFTPILLACAALGVACGDGAFELNPRVLTRLEVKPTAAALFTVGPGRGLGLTILAYDRAGALIPTADAVTYTSSAPAIAGVSSSGLVMAAAPGTAKITAALTLEGVTRTDSMTVTVHAGDYSDLAGVYDLTALVTSFDPAWGEDLTDYRYTAVVTLQDAWDAPWWYEGTYADLQLVGPGGDSYAITDSGSVTSFIDDRGQVVIELLGVGNRIGLTLIPATLGSGAIDGTFGCCGHIGGTFTARRRP